MDDLIQFSALRSTVTGNRDEEGGGEEEARDGLAEPMSSKHPIPLPYQGAKSGQQRGPSEGVILLATALGLFVLIAVASIIVLTTHTFGW